MNKPYYINLFRELGLLNGIRFSVWNKIQHRINGKYKGLWRIHINSIDYDVYIRPHTTDYCLIAEFFLNGAADESSRFQYDIDFSRKIKGPVRYIIDAGANIGLFSVLYARKFSQASIIAVEPEQENSCMLLKNIKNLNGVKFLRGGVWSRNCYLNVHESRTGEWGFTVSECSREDADVRAFSIPGIMKKYGFPYIDILKVDIEGSEYEIFKDKKCLEWLPLVKVLIIETHDRKIPGCEAAVMRRMKHLGFVFEKTGEDFVFYRKPWNG